MRNTIDCLVRDLVAGTQRGKEGYFVSAGNRIPGHLSHSIVTVQRAVMTYLKA
jgi:hypothetical protein